MYFWDIYLDLKKKKNILWRIPNPEGIDMGEITPNL